MADHEVATPTGPRLALLRRLGFGELTHDSHVPFLSHLLGTRRLLAEWGERPALRDAGLFHSVYGTEFFDHDRPVGRDEVIEVIGEEAEGIARLWCTIRRDTIELGDPTTAVDRHTGGRTILSDRMTCDIATLWAADTVEQIARMAPQERGFAVGLDRVLPLTGPAAREAAGAVLSLIQEWEERQDDPNAQR